MENLWIGEQTEICSGQSHDEDTVQMERGKKKITCHTKKQNINPRGKTVTVDKVTHFSNYFNVTFQFETRKRFLIVILTPQGRNSNNPIPKSCKHNFTFSSFLTNYCHNKHHLSYLLISSKMFCFYSNKKAFQTSSPPLTAARQRLFSAEPFPWWINEYLHSSSGTIRSPDSRVGGDKDTSQSESRRNKLCVCVSVQTASVWTETQSYMLWSHKHTKISWLQSSSITTTKIRRNSSERQPS